MTLGINKKIIETLIIIIIMLYVINFHQIGVYLLILATPVILIYSFKRELSQSFLFTLSILLLFGTIYGFFVFYYDFSGIGTVISLIVFPFAIYAFGYSIGEGSYGYEKTYIMLFVLIIVINVFLLLSYSKTIFEYGSLSSAEVILGERGFSNIWDGSIIKATEITVYLSFALALFPTLFVRDGTFNKKLILTLKIISLMSFLWSFFITMQLGSRTAIVIVIISIFTVFIFTHRLSIKKILSPFLGVVFAFFAWMLFNLNIFNLKTWWESTSVYERLNRSGLESSRYDAWKDILQGLLNHPLGGREIDLSINYAHNLWFDVAYDAGFLPFTLLFVFTLISGVVFIKFISLKHPIYLKALIISIFTSFFICFMTEPILQGGERYFFVIFCLFVGVIQGINKNLQMKNDVKN